MVPTPNLLTVGATGADFTTISEAIEAADNPSADNRYTVYVYPGVYRENVYCRQFVNIVGVNKSSVFLAPPPPKLLCNVKLEDYVELQNLTIWIPSGSTENDFSVVAIDKTNIGIRNCDIIPVDRSALAHCLYISGSRWTTYLIESLGMSYFGADGYAIELSGEGQNSDMHFVNLFVDALFIDQYASDGGCMHVANCNTVYLRNSLARTRKWGRCLRTGPLVPGKDYLVNVLVEGSSLEAVESSSALHVGGGTTCYFRHSSSDSINVEAGGTLVCSYPDRVVTIPGPWSRGP
jgi:hypothetical protein